jgi:O-antigen ligase
MESITAPENAAKRGRLDSARSLLALPAVRLSWRDADVIILAGLVAATATLGPQFSLLAIDGRVLQITEIAMLAVLILALRRHGWGTALRLLRTRLPVIALGILWISAAIALARGLANFPPSDLVYDARLFEYSLLLPIVVLAVDTRERAQLVLKALVLGAMAGTIAFGLTAITARVFDTTAWLSDVEGQIGMAGLYAGIFLTWIVARLAAGIRPSRVELVVGCLGVVLVGLTSKRGVWFAILATLPLVAATAAPGRRLRLALASVLAVIAGLGAAIAIEAQFGEPLPKSPPGLESEGSEVGGGQVGAEIIGLAGDDSVEGENVRWRISYWGELLSRSASQPILGAGFGPARFRWDGQRYDFRTDSEGNAANEVTGPHNAFISTLYRTGIVGLGALIAVIVFPLAAAFRSWQRSSSQTRRAELVTLAGILIATTAMACFSEAFRAQFLAIFFWVPLGLLMVERGLSNEPPTSRAPYNRPRSGGAPELESRAGL